MPQPLPTTIAIPEPATLQVGTLQTIGSQGEHSLARAQFPRPRSLTAYACVDLFNNSALASSRIIQDSALNELWVVGQIKLGMLGTQITAPFDMPLGQLVRIPCVADYLEITAKLVRIPTAAQFLNPPQAPVPIGGSLPDVFVTGYIGEGHGETGQSTRATRRFRTTFAAGAHSVRIPPPNWATHVRLSGTAAGGVGLVYSFELDDGSGNAIGPFPADDTNERPIAESTIVKVDVAAGPATFEAVFMLGL